MFAKNAVCHVAMVTNVVVLCHQKEEGKVQGQLNHTDSTQHIRDLRSQIEELKHEVRLLIRLFAQLLFRLHAQMSDLVCSFIW